jgi:hypothetical protein
LFSPTTLCLSNANPELFGRNISLRKYLLFLFNQTSMQPIPIDVLFVVVDLVGCEFRRAIAHSARDEPWNIKEDKHDRASKCSSLAALALACRALTQRAHAFLFEWVYLDNPEDAELLLHLSTLNPRLAGYVRFLDVRLLVSGAKHMQIAGP